MNYPCSVIRDLLPLYIDGVCSEESKKIIEAHLPVCTPCQQLLEEMKHTVPAVDRQADLRAAEMLKQIKKRINSRMARILLAVIFAAALVGGSIFLLFSEPLKQLGPEDVEMSAEVYALQTLITDTEAGDTLVEADIPGFGKITMEENTVLENPQITVVSMGSKYHLRHVHWKVEDDTLYVSRITTTLLGNEAMDGYGVSRTLNFESFDRIVYRPEDGGEEVLLWSRN